MMGYIPEQIAFVHSGTKKISRGWEDLDQGKEEEMVIPAFPVDPTNKKTMETARHWAGYRTYGEKSEKKIKTVTRTNKPFDYIRVTSIEYRQEGGRAWKIVDKDNYYFDMREDVLLDLLRHADVQRNAEIRGKFVWARVGTQMKVVRVDSALHKALVEATNVRNTKTISKKDLQPGDVCKSKSGDLGVFLGWVSGKEIVTVPEYKDSLEPGRRPHSYYHHRQHYLAGHNFKSESFKKRGLWWVGSSADVKEVEKKLFEQLNRTVPEKYAYGNQRKYWYTDFVLKKSHAFRQKVGMVDLPKDVIEQVRQLSLRVGAWRVSNTTKDYDNGTYSYNHGYA